MPPLCYLAIAFTASLVLGFIWPRCHRSESIPSPLILARGPLAPLVGGPVCGRTHPQPDPREPLPMRYFYVNKRYAVYSWIEGRWFFNFMCSADEYSRATEAPKVTVQHG